MYTTYLKKLLAEIAGLNADVARIREQNKTPEGYPSYPAICGAMDVTVSRAVIGISLMIATYAQAATLPTPSDLSSALTEARIAWGVQSNETIQFRLDPLNPCTLKDNPIIAQTQSLDTVTTMTFDDGTAPEVSHNLVWVIRINSNCDWSKLNLRNTITHELGHILISPNFHSANRRSIMYWIVSGDQKITPEDRAAVKRAAL